MDADNCYDCISHQIASLVFQSFGVPKEACVSLLKTIQDMKFFSELALVTPRNLPAQWETLKPKACVKVMALHWQGGRWTALQSYRRTNARDMVYISAVQ